MMDYPLELVEEVKIERIDVYDGKDFSYPKLDPPINTKRWWTPHTMIEAILWEISFMGPPIEQDKKHDEIMQAVDDVKNGLAKTRPFKELLDELKENLEEDEKDEEQEQNDE